MRDKLNRRTFIGGLGSTALAVTVAGCGNPEEEPEDDPPGANPENQTEEEPTDEPPGGDEPPGEEEEPGGDEEGQQGDDGAGNQSGGG